MTAPYKKRAKAGYNNDKSTSNRAERSFESKEIQEQFQEVTKSGSLGKKKNNKGSKEILRSIGDLKYALKLAAGHGLKTLTEAQGNDFYTRHYNIIYQKACLAIPYLKEKFNNADVDNKIKKQIKELLDQLTNT